MNMPEFSSGKEEIKLKIGLEGNFGTNQVSPRGLLATFLSRLVCIEGIVTKCSLVRPKTVQSVHFCPKTQKFQSVDYRDATFSGPGDVKSQAYPTKDNDGIIYFKMKYCFLF